MRSLMHPGDGPYRAKFMRLTATDQRYILSAQEDGIEWRGDDISMFRRIVAETLAYRDLSDSEKAEYRRSIIERVMNLRLSA